MKRRVLMLVNGDVWSAGGERARRLADFLSGEFHFVIEYRDQDRLSSMRRFLWRLVDQKPDVCYVMDAAWSGVLAGVLGKPAAGRLVIDSGDAIGELARSMGRRGVALALTRLLESVACRSADHLVVRSRFHRDWLAARGLSATAIPDGVDTLHFTPPPACERKDLVIGVLGSLTWSEPLQWCYGQELIEAIALLPGLPVRGELIGDGSGEPRLRGLCRRFGLEDRVRFHGRLPYDDLPGYLQQWDVCLSTQTSDLAGQVRTTGKLPLYMACGRYVLASRVGEARYVLPEEMLVDYNGLPDRGYPAKLAARISALLRDRSLLAAGLHNVEIARARFDYRVLAQSVAAVLRGEPTPWSETSKQDTPKCAA